MGFQKCYTEVICECVYVCVYVRLSMCARTDVYVFMQVSM